MIRKGILHGIRVGVTRPDDGGEDRLAGLLHRVGAIPVVVPVIDVLPPRDPKPLEEAARRALEYDWIIFTSRRAVEPFARLLEAAYITPERLRRRGVRICGVGPSTGGALLEVGISPDLLPERFLAESLVDALLGADEGNGVEGTRILFPRAKEGRDVIPEALSAAGARVEVVTAYRTRANPEGAERLAALLDRGQLDAMTFTASSAVASFASGWRGRHGGELPVWPSRVGVVAIGPITADTLRNESIPVDVVAHPHTLEGVVEALALWASRRSVEETEATRPTDAADATDAAEEGESLPETPKERGDR